MMSGRWRFIQGDFDLGFTGPSVKVAERIRQKILLRGMPEFVPNWSQTSGSRNLSSKSQLPYMQNAGWGGFH